MCFGISDDHIHVSRVAITFEGSSRFKVFVKVYVFAVVDTIGGWCVAYIASVVSWEADKDTTESALRVVLSVQHMILLDSLGVLFAYDDIIKRHEDRAKENSEVGDANRFATEYSEWALDCTVDFSESFVGQYGVHLPCMFKGEVEEFHGDSGLIHHSKSQVANVLPVRLVNSILFLVSGSGEGKLDAVSLRFGSQFSTSECCIIITMNVRQHVQVELSTGPIGCSPFLESGYDTWSIFLLHANGYEES